MGSSFLLLQVLLPTLRVQLHLITRLLKVTGDFSVLACLLQSIHLTLPGVDLLAILLMKPRESLEEIMTILPGELQVFMVPGLVMMSPVQELQTLILLHSILHQLLVVLQFLLVMVMKEILLLIIPKLSADPICLISPYQLTLPERTF